MMVRLLKHLGQTMIMILILAGVYLLSQDKASPMLRPMVYGLIAFLLVGIGVYIWQGRKKGLFCIVIIGLMCGLATGAWAQAEGNVEKNEVDSKYDVDALQPKGQSWCNAADTLDDKMEQYIKDNKNPLQEEPYKTAYDEANRYTYAFDLAAASGKIKETHWWKLEFANNKYEEALECAKEFLDIVAEYKTKSNEMALSTVRRVLEKDQNTCWPCGISLLVLNITEKVSLALEDNLRDAALDLVGLMLLFWIAYKVVVLIGQWGSANISEFFTQFLTRVVVVMIVSAILASVQNLNGVYSTLISPFISATADLTKSIVQMDSSPNASSMAIQLGAESNLLQCGCCDSQYANIKDDEDTTIPDCNDGEITGQKVNGENTYLISRQAKRQLMCMTCSIYKQTAPMIAIGRVMTYSSTHLGFWARMRNGAVGAGIGLLVGSPAVGAAVGAAMPWPLGMWLVGIGLIVVFTIISALAAFKMMDVFLRLGFVLLLTPFLVATFAFPSTRTYTKRGWDFLVNAMLNIVALAIGMAFVLVCYQTTLPEATTGALSGLVSLAGDPPNDYADDLYEAFTGGGGTGAFSTFFILMIFLFFGMKVLDASQVIIESLSETSSGLPSIAGAAMTAALRTATAPIRMGLIALMDHAKVPDIVKDRLKKDEDESPDDDRPGALSKAGKWMGDDAKKAGNAAAKTTEAAGKATETAGGGVEAAGQAGVATGRANRHAGLGLIKEGTLASSTLIGAIAGIPMIIAGAGMVVGGTATEAGGHIARFAGKGMKLAGQGMQKAAPLIKTAGKMTSVAIKKAGKKAQKQWNKTKRKIKNRIKQIPANIKKKLKQNLQKIKNAPKHLKNKLKKAMRRKAAKAKYGRKRPMSPMTYAMLRGTRNTMDSLLDEADEAVGRDDSASYGTGGAALENSETHNEGE